MALPGIKIVSQLPVHDGYDFVCLFKKDEAWYVYGGNYGKEDRYVPCVVQFSSVEEFWFWVGFAVFDLLGVDGTDSGVFNDLAVLQKDAEDLPLCPVLTA